MNSLATSTCHRLLQQAEKRLQQRLAKAGNDQQRIERARLDYEMVLRSCIESQRQQNRLPQRQVA